MGRLAFVLTPALALALVAPTGFHGLKPITEEQSPREIVVALDSPNDRADVQKRLRNLGATEVQAPRSDLLVVSAPPDDVTMLANRVRSVNGVAAAAPQGSVRALDFPPDDPAYTNTGRQPISLGPNTTYPHAVDLDSAWRQAFLGSDHTLNPYRAGVKVAVIDTGVSPYWREATGRLVHVRDYVEGDRVADDDNGHGTLVATVIGAKTGNGFGVAGALADANVTIEAYKVLDGTGRGTTADTLRAIKDAADRGCKVISCSLGQPTVDRYTGAEIPGLRALYDNAINYARARGCVVVAAAGNYYSSDPSWMRSVFLPARSDNAIAVGAISPSTGQRSSFSCYGTGLDIVAPGQSVWSVTKGGSTSSFAGTSLSTPITSGSLALLWSLVPSLSDDAIVDVLLDTATDYPYSSPNGYDILYGNGRLDTWAAYQRLMSTVPVQSDVSLTASAPRGRWTTLRWTRAEGTGVFYRYGVVGGPEFQTAGTAANLFLPSDGPQTVYVKEFASDRWANTTLATTTVTPSTGLPPMTATRRSGGDRYATSVAISKATYSDSAGAVVVASGANWPDALSASVLAHAAGGPLLLTPPTSLPIATRDEIVRLNPSRVYVVGGPPAVSSSVASRIAALVGSGRVKRVAGPDRYSTARKVGTQVRALTGRYPARAVIASGEKFPDALAAAPYAARAGYPILLTRRHSLPAQTRYALRENRIGRTVVLGSGAAISGKVARRLPRPSRIGGRDRYATSRLIAAYGASQRVISAEQVGIVTGRTFPDALAAGPLMAGLGGPVVLSDGLDSQTLRFFDARKLQVRGLTFVGGTVSQGVENALKTRMRH